MRARADPQQPLNPPVPSLCIRRRPDGPLRTDPDGERVRRHDSRIELHGPVAGPRRRQQRQLRQLALRVHRQLRIFRMKLPPDFPFLFNKPNLEMQTQ